MPWKGGRSHCCGLSGRFLPFLICFLIEGLALPAQLPSHYLLPVAQVLASLVWPLGYYLELRGWQRLPLWPGWGPVWILPCSSHPRGSHLDADLGGHVHAVGAAGPRGTLKSRRSFICRVPTGVIWDPETHKTWVLNHPKSEPFPKG